MTATILLTSKIANGLLAGVFFAFTVAVMPGLKAVDDHTFLIAMQRINVAIVNPVFLVVFLGAPALAVAAGFVDRSDVAWAAAVLGVVTLLVTFAVNIPLNNTLDKASLDAVAQAREHFENPWMIWNIVRTVTGIGAFACLLRL